MNKLDKLCCQITKYVDKHGKVVARQGTPFSAYLSMTGDFGDLHVSFRVQNSPYGNGSSYVMVRRDQELLLLAEGKFIMACYDMTAKTYVPGDWESQLC